MWTYVPPRVVGPAGIAMRDVQCGSLLAFGVREPRDHDDDVRSRVCLSLAVVAISMLALPSETKDDLLARLDWRLRDRRAP